MKVGDMAIFNKNLKNYVRVIENFRSVDIKDIFLNYLQNSPSTRKEVMNHDTPSGI